ncbi:hypothetical protein O3P69_013685 [Scylla paramamosain]|uniref:Uncharacterized protein n=1 Tax=Scylla paramamosain TaxID=85552 RepID=A0AAW0SQ42_SCYPA
MRKLLLSITLTWPRNCYSEKFLINSALESLLSSLDRLHLTCTAHSLALSPDAIQVATSPSPFHSPLQPPHLSQVFSSPPPLFHTSTTPPTTTPVLAYASATPLYWMDGGGGGGGVGESGGLSCLPYKGRPCDTKR